MVGNRLTLPVWRYLMIEGIEIRLPILCKRTKTNPPVKHSPWYSAIMMFWARWLSFRIENNAVNFLIFNIVNIRERGLMYRIGFPCGLIRENAKHRNRKTEKPRTKDSDPTSGQLIRRQKLGIEPFINTCNLGNMLCQRNTILSSLQILKSSMNIYTLPPVLFLSILLKQCCQVPSVLTNSIHTLFG